MNIKTNFSFYYSTLGANHFDSLYKKCLQMTVFTGWYFLCPTYWSNKLLLHIRWKSIITCINLYKRNRAEIRNAGGWLEARNTSKVTTSTNLRGLQVRLEKYMYGTEGPRDALLPKEIHLNKRREMNINLITIQMMMWWWSDRGRRQSIQKSSLFVIIFHLIRKGLHKYQISFIT